VSTAGGVSNAYSCARGGACTPPQRSRRRGRLSSTALRRASPAFTVVDYTCRVDLELLVGGDDASRAGRDGKLQRKSVAISSWLGWRCCVRDEAQQDEMETPPMPWMRTVSPALQLILDASSYS